MLHQHILHLGKEEDTSCMSCLCKHGLNAGFGMCVPPAGHCCKPPAGHCCKHRWGGLGNDTCAVIAKSTPTGLLAAMTSGCQTHAKPRAIQASQRL